MASDWIDKAAEEIYFSAKQGVQEIAAIIRRHRDDDPAEKEAKERALTRRFQQFNP